MQAVRGVLAADVQALYFDERPPTLEAYLSVELAHWDAKLTEFVPDQLLLINSQHGIQLSVQPAP
jgi:hypothetical protein